MPDIIADKADFPLELSVEEAFRILKTPPGHSMLIDVREPHEFDICHIEGAELIPMRKIPEHLASLSKNKHLLICCHIGARSMRVTQYLRARGYPATSNIAGGIDAWAEKIDPSMARY